MVITAALEDDSSILDYSCRTGKKVEDGSKYRIGVGRLAISVLYPPRLWTVCAVE